MRNKQSILSSRQYQRYPQPRPSSNFQPPTKDLVQDITPKPIKVLESKQDIKPQVHQPDISPPACAPPATTHNPAEAQKSVKNAKSKDQSVTSERNEQIRSGKHQIVSETQVPKEPSQDQVPQRSAEPIKAPVPPVNQPQLLGPPKDKSSLEVEKPANTTPSETEIVEEDDSQKNDKKFYKKPWFYILLVSLLIVGVTSGCLIFYFYTKEDSID